LSESLKICAIGIICAILCILVKNARSEFLIPTRIAGILVVFSFISLLISPVIDMIASLMQVSLPIESTKILIKTLSIAYIAHISSELCRECGENTIAFAIESTGKIEIIILGLPLIKSVIDLSKEILLW
jgi:stage III sporulation protein AD